MIISKIDNTICKNQLGLSIHLKKYGMTILDYYIKYEGFRIPKCKFCESYTNQRCGLKFTLTCGSVDCIKKDLKTRKLGEGAKEKIRKSRFEYLKNPENRKKTAWYRKSQNFLSYGENKLDSIFRKNKIYHKYDIINEYPIYPYFLDFGFVNEKVAVEYDGKCHFRNGKRIEHDIKKDSYLQKIGWRIYRISYLELDSFEISDLIEFIGNPSKKTRKNILERYPIAKEKKESKSDMRKREYENRQNEKVKILLNSNIDFSKIGWVNQVSSLLSIRHQKVNKWMKRFMSDFYKKSCFKKKIGQQ
jgi:very-short-patch-repair endonuclease